MTTATLARRCIACGHENALGGESCSSCGSSLDLKLCAACEAINAAAAERCHACGEAFSSGSRERAIEGQVVAVVRERDASMRTARRLNRFAMLLGVLALMIGLPAYLVLSGLANRLLPAVEKDERQANAPLPAKTATASSAKVRADGARSTEATGGIVQTADTGPARPAGPITGVTHTRRGPEAPVTKTVAQEKAAPVSAPKAAAALPDKTTAAAVMAQPVINESAPTALERPHVRVTHTKASAASAVVATGASEAGNTKSVSERSASAGNGRAPDCDERVAALGLCNSNVKLGGNR